MPLKKKKSRKRTKTSLNELEEVTKRLDALYNDPPIVEAEKIKESREILETVKKQTEKIQSPEKINNNKTTRQKFLEELALAQKKVEESQCNSEGPRPLDEEEIRDLRTVFEIFDLENTGRISTLDLQRALRFLRFKFKHGDFNRILTSAVKDVNDGIGARQEHFDFSVLLHCVSALQSTSRNTRAEILDGFKSFDLENKGRITLQNLKYLNKDNKLGFSDQELQEMFEEADGDGDGVVIEDEFLKIIMKTNLFV